MAERSSPIDAPRSARRQLPLGHLRPAVLRHDDQLRRPRRLRRARRRRCKKEIGWTDTQYGDINAAFTLAYAIGFLVLGWLIDGSARGWATRSALIVWSLAAAGHALAARRLRVRGRAVCPWARRSGQLSRRHQDHRRVVPPPRARPGHRDLQRRLERRRRSCARCSCPSLPLH